MTQGVRIIPVKCNTEETDSGKENGYGKTDNKDRLIDGGSRKL